MWCHKICPIHLNRFWRVSVPQETLGVDGSRRDPSRPVPIADKVCDGADVDEGLAADAVPAGNLRKVHQTGGQRHIGPLWTSSAFHRTRQMNRDIEEPALTELTAESLPHLRCWCQAPASGCRVLGAPSLPDTVQEPCSPPQAHTASRPPKCCWPLVAAVGETFIKKHPVLLQ